MFLANAYTNSMKIVVCTSASFYEQAVEVEKELQALGFDVVLPKTAYIMKKRNDFEVAKYKTWYEDESAYEKKAELMRTHFEEIAAGDVVLVLNYEKHGVPHYIGGNVLMEMGVGFYLRKPLYIFNEVPDDSPFLEEIKGFLPIVLHGNFKGITPL